MKKMYFFLLVILIIFFGCESDFEVHANWKEVTVVYGLLDQSHSQQYIKINKAFLGEGNALQMATIADSVNYNPEDLVVRIFKVKDVTSSTIDTISSILLDTTTSIIKDDGLFSTDKNIIYVTSIEDSSFFREDKEYILSIQNDRTGKEVWAETNLIHGLNLDIPSNKPIGFYNPITNPPVFPLQKATTTVNWYHSTNGKMYQIIARIYYTNFSQTDTILNYIDWIQPTIVYEGSNNMNYTFEGESFVNTLAKKISNSNKNLIARRLSHTELLFTVGSEDLQIYMSVNKPFEGIVQERPVFTNINNGIGLFSARYNKSHIMSFTSSTREGIAIDLDSLHFIYP